MWKRENVNLTFKKEKEKLQALSTAMQIACTLSLSPVYWHKKQQGTCFVYNEFTLFQAKQCILILWVIANSLGLYLNVLRWLIAKLRTFTDFNNNFWIML